jgi:hypothetical protein
VFVGSIPAQAGEDGLSPEQRATIAELHTPVTVARSASVTSKAPGVSLAIKTDANLKVGHLEMYRGSVLMWGRDSITWSYDGTDVKDSSLHQEAGYIVPNNAEAKGTERYRATSKDHTWNGKYKFGAGVPSPWGNVNAWSGDFTTEWHVHENGAGDGHWLD